MTQGTITHPHTAIAEGMQMEQPQIKPEAQRIIIEICLNALARKQAREAKEAQAKQAKSEEGKGDNARG